MEYLKNYFAPVPDDQSRLACNKCPNVSYKCDSSTGNFWRHLEKNHAADFRAADCPSSIGILRMTSKSSELTHIFGKMYYFIFHCVPGAYLIIIHLFRFEYGVQFGHDA